MLLNRYNNNNNNNNNHQSTFNYHTQANTAVHNTIYKTFAVALLTNYTCVHLTVVNMVGDSVCKFGGSTRLALLLASLVSLRSVVSAISDVSESVPPVDIALTESIESRTTGLNVPNTEPAEVHVDTVIICGLGVVLISRDGVVGNVHAEVLA